MRIKITDTAAIDAALAAANGRAHTHTYTSAAQLAALADRAEARLSDLGVAKAKRKGARVTARSGDRLPNAYKYRVTRTSVTLERGASDWFVTRVETREHFVSEGSGMALVLTADQDAAAVAVFRAQYSTAA